MTLFTRAYRPAALAGRYGTRYGREVPPVQRRAVEQGFRALWRDTAEGVGLARTVHVAAGVTVSVPRVGGIRLDEDGQVRSVTIQRHPGHPVADYRTSAALLADALGCARVSIEDLGTDRWLRLHLFDADPLAAPRAWHRRLPDGFLAITETGELFSAPWESRPHSVTQGSTGSGKSSWTYSQLAPLAGRRDVRVVGIDPSGLLWRPWPDDEPWRVFGVGGDLGAHRKVLRALCDEMDRRLTLLPKGADNLTTDDAVPLLVVVLEEYAALVRAAELVDRKVGAEVRALVGRLYSEGRKVGLRCLMLLQRADASIVDGAIRAQATLRVSFASEADGIAMLHPRQVIDPDEHSIAAPGVCAVTAPRVGTFRARSVLLDYAQYVATVGASS